MLVRRGLRALACVFLLAAPAFGQDPEARARDLNRDAMDEDYLATNFKAAIAKLETALKVCGAKCPKELLAKIHGNIGTVYAAGLGRQEDAVEAFKEMLRNEPTATPNSAYLTGDVQKAFETAKSSIGAAPVVVERAVNALVEKPWPEQATFHPVPVYVELPEGATASRVIVRYKSPGQSEWKELSLQKQGKGWGGYIPCSAVEKEGQLSYFTTAFDQNLDRVASGGSGDNPRRVQLKTAISGRQPSLPGAEPPTSCPRPEERLSCETDDDCPGNEVCRDLGCVPREDEPSAEDEEAAKRKLNWLSIGFSPDIMIVSSTDDACSPSGQDDGKYSCFYSGDVQFTGTPIDSGSSNSVSSGVGTGSMRILLGYDRVLAKRMVVGARLGFAFLGYPEREDGKSFLPFHAEARFAYHLLKDPFADKGVRPYVFAGGGLGEASARVPTKVVVDDGANGTRDDNVDVFVRYGPFFGMLGGGVQYAVSPQAAMVLELAGRAMLPEFGIVIAPTLGFAYGL
jgi:hypothetical protein